MSPIIVGAVAWKIRPVRSDLDFVEHLEEVVLGGHSAGCNLVVLPELPILELLAAFPAQSPAESCALLAGYAGMYEDTISKLSRITGMTLVGGSHFRATEKGVTNTALIAEPDGTRTFQDKIKLTAYEREEWGLVPGQGLARLVGRGIGTTICYDCEFPEAGRALAEAGMLVHCVPAFTERPHGHSRVRHSCHARAIENQVFVVHAPLIGTIGREPVPSAYGSAAVICPPIDPYPASGVLAKTPLNRESIAVASLSLSTLKVARSRGDVRNWHDRDPSPWVVAADHL